MPKNKLNEFIDRLTSLETKVDQHLQDGINVISNLAALKTDMDWIKKLLYIVAGAAITATASLILKLLLGK